MFEHSAFWGWLAAMLAVLPFIVGQVIGDDAGDGGDPGDGGGGEIDDMPTPPAGAWRGENPPAQNPPGNQPGRSAVPGENPNPTPPADDSNRRYTELETRHHELESRYNNLGAQFRSLQRMLGRAAGIDGPREPASPEDQRREKLLNQFFDLFPAQNRPLLRKLLLESPDRLAALAENAPQYEEATSRHWAGVARVTSARLWDGVAPLVLGEGKKGTDLDEETRLDVKDAFGRWIQRDQTGARADRYEMQDPSLVSEFTTWFKARYIDPGRRAAATTVINRGDRTKHLPVSGGGNQPVRTPAPAQPDTNDDDAVHKQAWAVAQSLRGGQ